MKRKIKKFSAAVLASATLAASGCEYEPENNIPETLYGPPDADLGEYEPDTNKNEDLYGPPVPKFEPDENIAVPLYGPPPAPDEFEGEWDIIDPEFDPEENENQDLYGVPEALEEEPTDIE